MKKKKKQIEVPEVSDVKLKPLLGMQPGLYLTILYALILVILMVLLLVVPGIRNYGSNVRFTSAPAGAAVYIDEQYYGSTPFTEFVPAGTHNVRYEKPFFQDLNREVEVPGKVFGTLFFERAERQSAKLSFDKPGEYLRWRFDQSSNWALVGSFYERYRYPFRGVQAVSEYLEAETSSVGTDPDEASAPKVLYDFAYMLLNNINSFEQLLDAAAAITILDSREYRYTTSNAYLGAAMAEELLQGSLDAFTLIGAQEVPAALYVEAAARQQSILDITGNQKYRAEREKVNTYLDSLPFSEVYSSTDIESIPMDVYDHTFVELRPPQQVPVGNNNFSVENSEFDFADLSAFPHTERLQPFHISTGEVTRGQFARFLQELPEWRVENTEELIEQNMVDENYLGYMNSGPADSDLPVSGVSWYAARAYCEWLEKRLPDDMQARYNVRLPSEAEWEYAARKNSDARVVDRNSGFDGPQAGNYSREGRIGLVDMQGNVWEWCENWYFPADVLDGVYGAALPGYSGRERALRGGSWVNRASEVAVWKRASQPPHWCSPFLGFRIVLEPKQE